MQLLLILAGVCFCALIANRLKLAPPIAFLIGGILLALVPGMPAVSIDPEYMLLIFLPPILMEAAFFTSIRDFRSQLRTIMLLAVGLVILTAAATAWVVTELLPGSSWALGFVLGAIISPPDAAAATGALKGITLPKRIVNILEGESLINDATGIVIYKFAIGAVLAGSFSALDASGMLISKTIGGIAIGLLIAYAFVKLFPYLRDPSVEILTTFLPPYAAFMLAEAAHVSGVLAVVACGLYIGWHAPKLFSPKMRIPAEAVWRMVVYFLNALAFLLIGLQLPGLAQRLDILERPPLMALAAVVCVASVAVRFAWVYTMAFGLRYLLNQLRTKREEYPSWQNVFVIGWTGLRGVVTLALALALPLTLPDGSPFPYRDEIIFLSISVIVFTLVLQGISLRWLLSKLTLSYDPRRMQEEWYARVEAARNAVARLDEMANDGTVHKPALNRIREHYSERLQSLGDGPNTPLNADHAPGLMSHPLLQAENRLWAEVLRRERETLLDLRRNFKLGDDTLYDILREMDLLAARFHHEESSSELSSQADDAKARQSFWRKTHCKLAEEKMTNLA